MNIELDDQLVRAIELARELPADVPPLGHREQVRTTLLARAARPTAAIPRSRGKIVIAAIAFVAAAAAAVYLASRTDAPQPIARHDHGSVRARAGTLFTQTSRAPDEIVLLHDGTIDISVEPLGPGDRFRVIVGASEVEVRGTAFTVTADHDGLVAVAVAHGRVEVRPSGRAMTVLEAGQTWHVEIATVTPVSPPPVTALPAAKPRSIPKPHEIVATITAPQVAPSIVHPPDEVAYDEAWDALRANKFHQAALAFARGLALAPDGALADDARFWHAVALAREPRAAEAIAAFRELVDEHPGNAHHGEASAMLGWLLVDAKELTEAAQRFHAAENDPTDKIRASARAGLAALHDR